MHSLLSYRTHRLRTTPTAFVPDVIRDPVTFVMLARCCYDAREHNAAHIAFTPFSPHSSHTQPSNRTNGYCTTPTTLMMAFAQGMQFAHAHYAKNSIYLRLISP